jgi:hypothetical protein
VAKRTRDIVNAFNTAFGGGQINNRLRGVLCGYPNDTDVFVLDKLTNMLTYLNAQYGAPSGYLYGIGTANYFGGPAASGEAGYESYTEAQILSNMHSVIAGTATDRTARKNLAASYSLTGGYMAYEGGPDTGGGSTTNLANRVRVHRNSDMYNEYRYNLIYNWWSLGCGMSTQFTIWSPNTRYGAWGMTEN